MKKSAIAVLAGGILVANLAAAQAGSSAGSQAESQGRATESATQPAPQGGRGHGMMGNHGMMGGPGMMGGGGMMGGFGFRNIPDLTTDQRSKITAIRRDLRNRQLGLMDQMHDQWAGTSYYRNGQFDEQAARRAYDATEKIHRQMFENSLDAQKRIDALLTPAQRQQLQRSYGGQQ
jgi:Spy/CpxP family protein refolding chaperone